MMMSSLVLPCFLTRIVAPSSTAAARYLSILIARRMTSVSVVLRARASSRRVSIASGGRLIVVLTARGADCARFAGVDMVATPFLRGTSSGRGVYHTIAISGKVWGTRKTTQEHVLSLLKDGILGDPKVWGAACRARS